MKDYYKILGIKNSASQDELKRAYRILARRYHPDINGNKDAADRFKEIQEAYNTLRDTEKKKLYDATAEAFQRASFNQKLKSYTRHSSAQSSGPSTTRGNTTGDNFKNQQKPEQTKHKTSPGTTQDPFAEFSKMVDGSSGFLKQSVAWIKNQKEDLSRKIKRITNTKNPIKLSIVEVSISIEESIKGVRKKIEILEPEGSRRVMVTIPPGVRDGSTIRLRNRSDKQEDLVAIIRLASHPYLSIKPKGLIIEVPITVSEAINGAQIKVPGIDDTILMKVSPGSQSGTEIRVTNMGIPAKDGRRGDLFVRLLVIVPSEPNAALLKEKVEALDSYYTEDVRSNLPPTLI